MKDWDAAFRTWLRNAVKWRKDAPADSVAPTYWTDWRTTPHRAVSATPDDPCYKCQLSAGHEIHQEAE